MCSLCGPSQQLQGHPSVPTARNTKGGHPCCTRGLQSMLGSPHGMRDWHTPQNLLSALAPLQVDPSSRNTPHPTPSCPDTLLPAACSWVVARRLWSSDAGDTGCPLSRDLSCALLPALQCMMLVLVPDTADARTHTKLDASYESPNRLLGAYKTHPFPPTF